MLTESPVIRENHHRYHLFEPAWTPMTLFLFLLSQGSKACVVLYNR